jgi:hypothetical protein
MYYYLLKTKFFSRLICRITQKVSRFSSLMEANTKTLSHELTKRKDANENCFHRDITGLQINLYLEQPMEIQLFATFFQRRK